MVKFFQNIWAWICFYAAQIAGVLTPANLILLATAVWQLLRQRKKITENTDSSKELKKSLEEVKTMREELAELKALVVAQNEQIAALRDGQTQTNTKLNCVLDVQQQAYSVSLAKTNTLDAINGIIANGKFADANSSKAIVEEVAELREQMEKLTAASKASEAKVKRIAGVSESKSETRGVRYD